MPASIRTTTPSGAGDGVSTSSKRRSLCACRRQALWVFVIVMPSHSSFRPRKFSAKASKRGPDCLLTGLYVVRGGGCTNLKAARTSDAGATRAGFVRQMLRQRQRQWTYRECRRGGRRSRHGRAERITQEAVEHRRDR